MTHLHWKNPGKIVRLVAVALAAALAAPTAAFPAGKEAAEHDDATRRRQAMDEWYNDVRANHGKGKKNGGPWSAAYRRFMLDAAARERARWGAQIPGAESTQAQPAGSTVAAVSASGAWFNIGPTRADFLTNGGTTLNVTDTGRVRSVVVDPANAGIIYVAYSGGGVWRTLDDGATWASLSDALGTLSTGALAMDPANSSTLYLGLGDPFDGTGIGLVKSTNGGDTWSAPVYLGASTVTPDVLVSRTDSNVVMAATNAGLFRSTDAGATWTAAALATGFPGAPYVWSLAWAGGTRYVATLEADPANTSASAGQVWASADNGATWTRATGIGAVGRMTVAAATAVDPAPAILYVLASTTAGDLAEVYKSTDGGATFVATGAARKRYTNGNREARNLSGIFNTQGWYDQGIAVNPADPNEVYMGGALHVARTRDGGATWSQVSNWLAQFGLPYVHADLHAITFAGNRLYLGTDGGVFVSEDNGVTFDDRLNVGIASHLFYSVGSSTAAPDAVVGGLQDNGTRVRVGSSTTYNQVLGGDGFGSDIHPTDGQSMLGTLYYTRIYKSTNGGTSFASACSGIRECGSATGGVFITKVIPWGGDPTGNTVFTYAAAKVYKSANYATRWTALGTAGIPSGLAIRGFGVSRYNGNLMGIAGTSGRLLLSTNAGTSWTLKAATELPDNGLSLSAVAYAQDGTIFVASVAPDQNAAHLWKSSDGGATFVRADNLGNGFPTGIPVNHLVLDPQNATTIYAATHLGVYVSTNLGTTWVRYGTGMPLVNVTDLYVAPDGSFARAATFGRAIWQMN
jgi:hypothetical protein